jgi:hypothetical protein
MTFPVIKNVFTCGLLLLHVYYTMYITTTRVLHYITTTRVLHYITTTRVLHYITTTRALH